jgi:hypothetical protein
MWVLFASCGDSAVIKRGRIALLGDCDVHFRSTVCGGGQVVLVTVGKAQHDNKGVSGPLTR